MNHALPTGEKKVSEVQVADRLYRVMFDDQHTITGTVVKVQSTELDGRPVRMFTIRNLRGWVDSSAFLGSDDTVKTWEVTETEEAVILINYAETEHMFYVYRPQAGDGNMGTLTVVERFSGNDSRRTIPVDDGSSFWLTFVIRVMASFAPAVRVKLDDIAAAFGLHDIRTSVATAIDYGYLAVSEPCYHEKHGQLSHRCVLRDDSD